MTEMAKTVFFLAAAGVALTLAFLLGPSDSEQNYDEQIGTRLNQFEADLAKRLKIVKFDTETATPREFEVAETDGLWTIPSKNEYPADATEQMAGAATCLMNREVLRVAGKNASEHKTLGVVSPNASKLDSKSEGVGTRVTITDINDKLLTDMIIGKPVKDADGQYYVRNANQDIVYVVNLDTDKLSTKFEDWIEHDLLQLNPIDILQIAIKDYSVELQRRISPQGRLETSVLWERRSEMTLSDKHNGHDHSGEQEESQWLAKSLLKFDSVSKDMIPFELTETETLNKENLTAMRDGLADLLLIDVERKPDGLSEALKEGADFYKDIDAAQSLMNRGFAPLSTGEGKPVEILSTEGEIVCTLQDGVEYVLRFGNLQIGEEEAATETDSQDEEVDADSGINRYLFVMARLNESVLPKPEMQELPELPETKEDSKESEEASTTDDNPKDKETKETAPGELASAGGEPQKSPTTDSKAETARKAILAERKQIETENQRRQDEYDDQLQASKDRVQALNERFGDWYYVISNEVYKQIHLSREQVITLKSDQATDPAKGTPPASLPGVPNLPFGIGAPK